MARNAAGHALGMPAWPLHLASPVDAGDFTIFPWGMGMRALSMGLLCLLCTPFVHAADAPLERHSLGSWEADIGFSGVVRDGDTLHVSGIACAGADMQAAVQTCYRQLNDILQRFDVDSSHVVKETIYTTDMEALIKAIPARKTFFADAKYPAATWVQVSRLFDRAHLLEVEWTVRLR